MTDPTPTVVHVTEAYGGVETYLRLLVSHWPTVPNFVFVLSADNALAQWLRAEGFRVIIHPIPRTTTRFAELRSSVRLRRVLRELDPDVVHLHSSQAGFVGRLASRGEPWSVVYTPHAYHYLGFHGLRRRIFKQAERMLDRVCPAMIVATSPSEEARSTNDLNIPGSRVRSVLNGVELGPSRPRAAARRPTHVGMVARVTPQKRIDVFLRAARLIRQTHPDVRFSIVGTGHYAGDNATLGSMIHDAHMSSDDVTVLPWLPREEMLAWLDSCDIVALTSDFESFGYVVAEAAARAIPVVATAVDGVRDVVEDGVSGILCSPGDHRAVADAVARLVSEPATYGSMSAGALRVARECLDVRRTTRELDGVYRALQ